MSQTNQIQLKISSILNVPLQIYDSDFSFIVNGKEFKTSRLISELISPNICKIHLSDPTIDSITINTNEQGDFSHFLQLATFNKIDIQLNELEFIKEIVDILGSENLIITEELDPTEITLDNIFPLVKKHEIFSKFSTKQLEKEIDFISSHFYEICESKEDELVALKESTLFQVITNQNLQLKDEDQLLNFVNKFYSKDSNCSIMYESVIFSNVSSESMKKFIENFDFNDLTNLMWNSISKRLEEETVKNDQHDIHRYTKQLGANVVTFEYNGNNELNGIIRYLTNKVGQNIHDSGTIEVTTNSFNSDSYHQKNLLDLDKDNTFWSLNNGRSAWICFGFKEMKVNLSAYTIKTGSGGKGSSHVKNWVMEVSDDGANWEIVDEHTDYEGLNGSNLIKTFDVKPSNFSRYCRFRHTGDYWGYSSVYLVIKSIEFFGKLQFSD